MRITERKREREMHELMILSALVISLAGNLFLFTRDERIRRVLAVALDKAEKDRAGFVKIPVNQVIAWGFQPRHGLWRDPKEFNHKAGGPHPATLRAHRRSKL